MVAIFTGSGVGFERGSGSVLGSSGLLGNSSIGRGGDQLSFNAATGNLMVSQRDEYLVGLGLDASVTRTYNSMGDLSDENGDNWRHGYDRRIVNAPGSYGAALSTVQRVSGDGSVITYTWDATWNNNTGAYVATDGGGAYDALTRLGNVWTWTDGDSQVKETYDETASGSGVWRLKTQADTDGITVNFAYNASGRLSQVTTAGSGFGVSTLTYVWNQTYPDRLDAVVTGYWDLSVDPNNPVYRELTRTSYTYETYGANKSRLQTVRVDYTPNDNVVDTNGNQTIEAAEGYVTTYSYDGNSTRITRIAQSDGSQIDIVYEVNGSGKVWKLKQTANTGVERTTEFTYGAGFTDIKDPLDLVTRLEYDANNQLAKVTLPFDRPGGDQQSVEFAYNGTGDVLSVTTNRYNATSGLQTTGVTSYTYGNAANPDAVDRGFADHGLAYKITDRENNVVTRTYGDKNQLLTETTVSSDADTDTDAGTPNPQSSDHTIRFVYDGENHLRYRISAEGGVTEYRYTNAGLLQYTLAFPEHPYTGTDLSTLPYEEWLAAVDSWEALIPDESSIELNQLTYDVRGNITQDRRFSIATQSGGTTSAEGKLYTFYTYDQAGKLLFRNVENRNVETFVYDGMGRVTSAVDVNGATTTYMFNDAATTTTVTFATGLRQVSVYNKAGELISFTEQAVTSTSPQESVGVAQYKYDSNGRLRWQMDATNRKSYFVYDQLGRKVADVSANGDVIEYRYDASNRLIATIAHGNRLASTTPLEDENGTVDLANFFPASSTSDLWTWHIYDKEGRLRQTIAGDGSTSIMTYDGLGRLVSTVSYYGKLAVAGYKSTSLPTTVVTPASHAKDAVARNFYDKDGRLIGILDGEGYLTKIDYDKAGRKIQETRFWNITSGNRASGSFNTLKNSIAPDSIRDRINRYVYNGQGQLRFIVDATLHVTERLFDVSGDGTVVITYTNTLSGSTTDFTYDAIKLQVTGAGFASATDRKTYSVYDSVGRVAYSIDAEGAVTSYAYNLVGQVTRITQFKNARVTTALPSLATMDDTWAPANVDPATDRVTRFYYDGVGALRYTIDGEGYVTRHEVDAEGRATETWTYANKISVDNSDTTTDVDILLAAAGGAIAKTITVYDTLGRVEKFTDAEGSITHYAYGANGLVSEETIAWGTNDAAIVHYVYDGAGRVIEQHAAFGTSDVSVVKTSYNGMGDVEWVEDPLGNKSYHYYDKRGLLIRTRDAENYLTEYSYTAFGETDTVIRRAVKTVSPISVETPPTAAANGADAITSHTYDKRGLVTAVRDSEDYVTETSYTAFGQVLSVTRRYTKATGDRVSGTSPTVAAHAKDAVTSFEYDRRGLVTKTTDAEGYFEVYGLNAFGNRVSVTSKSYGVDGSGIRLTGGIVLNEYDRRGLLVKETLPMISWNADGTIQASTVINKFEYDARGNRTKMIEAFGLTEQRTTNYEYDKVNRLTAKKLDAVTAVSYSDFTSSTAVTVTSSPGVIPTESYIYDAAGRLKQVTDALGGRTVSFYDDLGRKTAEVGPLGTMTEWTYDAAGNVTKVRVYGAAVTVPAVTDPKPTPPSSVRETLYTYDSLNRLKTTSIANVLVGSWNGTSGVAPTPATITTTLDYDANGNVIKTTDANLYSVYSYYDRLGRKTAQVDAEGHLTSWSYDGEGNVLKEERFATRLPTAASTTSNPVDLRSSVAGNADDRITDFTYDRNGHRLTETRTGVKTAIVNPNNTLTEPTVSSTIIYTYNGLGQVLTKAEATGDTVSYIYDATGRLTKESRASYTDHASASVTPTVEYLYNGLNNLSRTRQGGATAAAGDRITTYTYGANGRLASLTDPAGGVHAYDYDAAGNLVRDSYTRLKSDGVTSVNEGILYRRDLLARVVGQAIATDNAGTWTRGDWQNTAYNAYGDVSQRGINGLWQERFFYDNRGLVEQTNSGDGVWRFFVYDANGNKTLTIEDENYNPQGIPQDLGTKTLSQVLGYLGATAGATFVDGLNVTIATYDKRGLALASYLTQRELKANDPRYTIASSQTYNAFGEVATQTRAYRLSVDTAPQATLLTYNTMGRLTKKELPTVSWTSETGAVDNARPTELYYYDKSGRLVASRDANGNLTSRSLLAGSGYGEAEALVTAEYHADGGIARTFYDKFGDARILRNELYDGTNATLTDDVRTYDAMGRLITQVHRGALLTENFTYDLLGQRITHWNSFLGATNKETTDFDLQGRVTKQVAFGGDAIYSYYQWDATIATSGMGTFGGWLQTDVYVNGSTMQVKSDVFGHDTWKSDLGGHVFTFTYDKAGRQLTRVTTGETLTTTWFNTGLNARVEFGATDYATFSYDANGNRMSEYTRRNNIAVQDASATYDALGRLAIWTEVGGTKVGAASKTIEYDLNGNIRRSLSSEKTLTETGAISSPIVQDLWYRYDAMNRVVTTDGQLSGTAGAAGTQIVRGAGSSVTINGTRSRGPGQDVVYNVAGQRVSATYTEHFYKELPENAAGDIVIIENWTEKKELYVYRADGVLAEVRTASGSSSENPGTIPAATGSGGLTGSFTYDAMGRLKQQIDYNGFGAGYDRTVTYNEKGQITYEVVITLRLDSGSGISDAYRDEITNSYGTGATYALGSITAITVNALKDGVDSDALDTSTTNTYAWYDGAVLSSTEHDYDTGGSNNNYVSTYNNSASGVLNSVVIDDGRDRTVSFTNDMGGQVIRRDEYDTNGSMGDPHGIWYRFNGREVATSANQPTPTQMTYDESADARSVTPPSNYTFTAQPTVDSDLSYDQISSYRQGSAAGRYVVQGGETMQSIAQAVWGDASLWYKLAEANGLSGDAMLFEGQQLNLPAGVVRSKNSASTFKPYDAAETLGNTSPTAPKPPKAKKCGMLGQILLAAVAIAVTIILPPAGGVIGTALQAMAVSAVTQAVGVVTGIQDKFSWKSVAMAGITAGVGGGQTGNILADFAIGAAASAISQGIGVATGLQKKFDWAGVAAAGLSNAVGAQVGQALGPQASRAAHAAIGGSARLIANAASRSILTGSSFGDNLIAGLPDVIAQTLGGMVEDGIAAGRAKRLAAAQAGAQTAQTSGTALAAPGSTGQTTEASQGVGDRADGQGSGAGLAAPAEQQPEEEIVVTGPSRKVREALRLNAQPTFLRSISNGRYRTETYAFPKNGQGEFDAAVRQNPGMSGARAQALALAIAEKYGLSDYKGGDLSGWNEWAKAKTRTNALTYEVTVENSAIEQALNDLVQTPAGTAVLSELNAGSFGIVGMLDSNGALELTRAQNPRAAMVGDYIGFVPSLLEGGFVLRGALKTGDNVVIDAAKGSATWFDDVARAATRNPDSDKLVLGHFAKEGVSYQKVAAHYNATYFKVDDWASVTKGLSQDEIWRINETFLTQQIRQGKQVLFSHNPTAARAGSFFEREVTYLKDLGYTFKQKNQWTWEAIR